MSPGGDNGSRNGRRVDGPGPAESPAADGGVEAEFARIAELAGSGELAAARAALRRLARRASAAGLDAASARASGLAASLDRLLAERADEVAAAVLASAARAMVAGDADGALRKVRAARRQALDGAAPLAYLAACVAEAALAEEAGDDVAAYGSLATGYATLGDLVGREVSADAFGEPLRELRERWGPERFAAAKDGYEARRRESPPPA